MMQKNPAQARQILMAKPELTKSLFFVSSRTLLRPLPRSRHAGCSVPGCNCRTVETTL
jgi:hypothetical protein